MGCKKRATGTLRFIKYSRLVRWIFGRAFVCVSSCIHAVRLRNNWHCVVWNVSLRLKINFSVCGFACIESESASVLVKVAENSRVMRNWGWFAAVRAVQKLLQNVVQNNGNLKCLVFCSLVGALRRFCLRFRQNKHKNCLYSASYLWLRYCYIYNFINCRSISRNYGTETVHYVRQRSVTIITTVLGL